MLCCSANKPHGDLNHTKTSHFAVAVSSVSTVSTAPLLLRLQLLSSSTHAATNILLDIKEAILYHSRSITALTC